MVTRMFFPLTEAAQVTPVAPSGADWDHVNGVTRKLLQTADSSTLTNTAYNPDGADHLVSGQSCHRSYVSEAMNAQTLSGNVKAQLQMFESNTNNNISHTLKILVLSNDGGTVQATLLAALKDGTEAHTSLRNLSFGSVALTSYACAAGDRLCVEVGVGGTPTAGPGANAHNATIRWGCSASSGDLPEDDTQTGTTYRGWIEFDGTFTFATAQNAGGYYKVP